MRKQKGEKKKAAIESRVILDSYEFWLAGQAVKSPRAKSGFVSASETEEAS